MNSECKIVAITQPLITKNKSTFPQYEPEVRLTPDEFIAYAARVSNPSNQMNTLTAPKLVKYLIKHRHWSPFEMVSATMEVTTTRDIARQMLRHRSFSFQEFSQRYADPTEELGFVYREARLQDLMNRQNSIDTKDDLLQLYWEVEQQKVKQASEHAYKWAIANGIAKEQARVVLPEGLTVSRLYMEGTLRSWIHYCDVRNTPGETQKEHVEIANACQEEIIKHFPSLKEYFEQQPNDS